LEVVVFGLREYRVFPTTTLKTGNSK